MPLPHSGSSSTPHDGANERWCNDSFLVPCGNGYVVEVGFALDCCDRECIAAAR